MSNEYLFLNKIQYDHNSHKAILIFRYKGITKEISVNLIETNTLDGGIIQGMNSNEFEKFIMTFMDAKDRARKLDRMHKIIWGHIKGEEVLTFPVKIL